MSTIFVQYFNILYKKNSYVSHIVIYLLIQCIILAIGIINHLSNLGGLVRLSFFVYKN